MGDENIDTMVAPETRAASEQVSEQEIVCGDSLDVLRQMADESVHCAVTSPPYFGLRDYGSPARAWGGDAVCAHEWSADRVRADKRGVKGSTVEGAAQFEAKRFDVNNGATCLRGCGAWLGAFGLEPTPEMYCEHAVEIFREVRRVLRRDGTFWLNIGDSFVGGGNGGGGAFARHAASGADKNEMAWWKKGGNKLPTEYKPKDLIGIPWMLAFALRRDGWYLRSDIVWSKGNSMPESVRDRPTRSHEFVFLLTKSPKYFYDDEAVKEDAVGGHKSASFKRSGSKRGVAHVDQTMGTHREDREDVHYNGEKRNRRSVWNINSKPFKGAHFAVMPEALVEPCVMAGTSERGVCAACGAPHKRVVERTAMVIEPSARRAEAHAAGAGSGRTAMSCTMTQAPTSRTVGWEATCSCGAGVAPAVVLDPFAGSGTVGVVCKRLGRSFLGIDLNPEYCAMARERIAGS